MEIIDKIKQALEQGTRSKTKTAMFHSQVLIHATELREIDPADFCKRLGIQPTYAIEFRKMLAAAQMIDALGFTITPVKR